MSTAPAKVDVQPIAHDAQIRERLESVLSATGWFTDPEVRVEQGVVFLSGSTDSEELKKWAGDLARHTQDVVAVANQLDVTRPSAWDFSAGWSGLLDVWLDVVRAVPFVIFGMFILVLSALLGWLAAKGARRALFRIVRAKLLRTVLARAIGVFVFLAGAYIVLRVSGLTQLALTVVGGTGLIGLAVGIAFRDITENFLSSIFLSLQRPFETGDLIEVNNVTGYVQQLNIRTTVLMTLDGNLVQIPNATVYKSTLRNFTVNRNRRESFVVGIGYADPIDAAQEIARQVLSDHPAVLSDPEPWVLADSLGQSTVNLRIYFWLDGHQYSWLKVRSSVLRLVKRAFQEHGISMPDEAREVIFPRGVPVTLLGQNIAENHDSARLPAAAPPSTSAAEAQTAAPQPKRPQIGPAAAPTVPRAAVTANDGEKEVSNKAEGGLASEAGVLNEQARQAQPADAGENLLRGKK
ncbi:MAG TPA: mechanosensitive ion channel family protein [Pirellulales bacterium]|nr:mechanosensitive ion channel family protein [Pirellulales bacterium]